MQFRNLWSTLIFCLSIGFGELISEVHNDTIDGPLQADGFCPSLELDRSIKVECSINDSSCRGPRTSSLWPKDETEIRLITSSRAGKRMAASLLPNLNYRETEEQRLFDINTTLYVDTAAKLGSEVNFGIELDPERMGPRETEAMIEQFLSDGRWLSLRYLIIVWSPDHADKLIDTITAKLKNKPLTESDTYRVLFRLGIGELEKWPELFKKSTDELASNERVIYLSSIINGLSKASKIDLDQIKSLVGWQTFVHQDELDDLMKMDSGSDKPLIMSTVHQSVESRSYENLNRSNGIRLMMVMSRKKRKVMEVGDWQDAQDFAVEILNHLSHNVGDIFVETDPIYRIENWDLDTLQHHSIYTLKGDDNRYYIAPRFYALAHFGRFLDKSPVRLKSWVDTAPNMFAAHYIAFKVTNGTVVVALNSNEHLVPFRISIDGTIRVHTDLEPKSFNTFLIP